VLLPLQWQPRLQVARVTGRSHTRVVTPVGGVRERAAIARASMPMKVSRQKLRRMAAVDAVMSCYKMMF